MTYDELKQIVAPFRHVPAFDAVHEAADSANIFVCIPAVQAAIAAPVNSPLVKLHLRGWLNGVRQSMEKAA